MEGSYQKLQEGLNGAVVLISQQSVESGCMKCTVTSYRPLRHA